MLVGVISNQENERGGKEVAKKADDTDDLRFETKTRGMVEDALVLLGFACCVCVTLFSLPLFFCVVVLP